MCKVGKKVTNLAHGNAVRRHWVAETLFKVGAIKASLEQKCHQPCTSKQPALNKSVTNLAQANDQPCTNKGPTLNKHKTSLA